MKKTKYYHSALLLLLGASPAGLAVPGPDYINVKDYGAVGNGSTNDAPAIQAAFDAADAAKVSGGSGPAVFFPTGTYRVTSTLVWKDHSIIGTNDRAAVIAWDGATTSSCMTSASLINKRIEDVHFRVSSTNRPANWIYITGNTEAGQIRRCSFGFTSGSGAGSIRLGNVLQARFHDLRFDRGQAYQIEINQTATGGSFALDGFTIDLADSTAKGLIRYVAANTSAHLQIKVANARLESNSAMVAPAAIVSVEGSYGLMPAYISLENLDIQIATPQTMVHQAGGAGNPNAVSQVVMRNVQAYNGTATTLSGSWGSELGGIPPIPSVGRIRFLAVGRSPAGATKENMVQLQNVSIGVGGVPITGQMSGSASRTFSSIGDGQQTSVSLTVPGASIGDTVLVGCLAPVPAGAVLSGSVTALNTVTATLYNKTGGALNIGTTQVRAVVWKH